MAHDKYFGQERNVKLKAALQDYEKSWS
jgi:hypothetical protein